MITVDNCIKSKTALSILDRTLLLAAFKLKGINVLSSGDFTHTISPDRVKVSIPKKVKFSVSRQSIEKFMNMGFWMVPVTTLAGRLIYHIYGTQLAASRGTQFLQARLNTPSDDDSKAIKPVQKITGESLIEATADGESYWHCNWKPSNIVAKL
jgi:hypothetical protein